MSELGSYFHKQIYLKLGCAETRFYCVYEGCLRNGQAYQGRLKYFHFEQTAVFAQPDDSIVSVLVPILEFLEFLNIHVIEVLKPNNTSKWRVRNEREDAHST